MCENSFTMLHRLSLPNRWCFDLVFDFVWDSASGLAGKEKKIIRTILHLKNVLVFFKGSYYDAFQPLSQIQRCHFFKFLPFMLYILPAFLAATIVNCVPFPEDSNGLMDDKNVIDTMADLPTLVWGEKDDMEPIEVSNNPAVENNFQWTEIPSTLSQEKDETGSRLNEIAKVCDSNLDKNNIARRQECTTKDSVQAPEKPAEGVTLHPKVYPEFHVKSTSDPQCVNFPSRPSYVTCGGPEHYGPKQKALDSAMVYNCFAGMNTLRLASSFRNWWVQDSLINCPHEDGIRLLPKSPVIAVLSFRITWVNGVFFSTLFDVVDFDEQYPEYVAFICAKLSPYPDIQRMSVLAGDRWLRKEENRYPAYPPGDANLWQRIQHFINTPL